MSVKHLNQVDLSRRWNITPRTLERWRWLGQGPRYLKIGGRVVYRVDESRHTKRSKRARALQIFPRSRPTRAVPELTAADFDDDRRSRRQPAG